MVSHHFREDGARAGPRLDDFLFAGRVHCLDAGKKARFYERTLFKLLLTMTPYDSATSCDDG